MKYIKLETVMWRITKHPQLKDISIEEVAEFSEYLLKLMNVPASLVTEVDTFEVKEFRVPIPSCAKDILGVRYIDERGTPFALMYGANPYHTSNITRGLNKKNSHKRYNHITPTHIKPDYPYQHVDNDEFHDRHLEYSYILQGNYIITSFDKGIVEVSYNMLPSDENGFPLIPDEESYIRALEYEIRMRYLEPQWEMGKVTDKAFQRIQQERDWYVGQASTVMKTINYDQFDMVAKGVNRLLVNPRPRDTFWRRYGEQEKIKTHA